MQILDIRGPGTTSAVLDALRTGPVVVQLSTVFAVIAPGTRTGAAWLDRVKDRIPDKIYGSLIGVADDFWAMARDLAHEQIDALRGLEDVFIRIAITRADFDSPCVRAGRHQGLGLSGPAGVLARAIQQHTEPDPWLYAGHEYAGPLATSWNMSGAPGGSITEFEPAAALARQRGVALLVTGPSADARGSYPIIEPGPDGLEVRRPGPGLQAVLRQARDRRLPGHGGRDAQGIPV